MRQILVLIYNDEFGKNRYDDYLENTNKDH